MVESAPCEPTPPTVELAFLPPVVEPSPPVVTQPAPTHPEAQPPDVFTSPPPFCTPSPVDEPPLDDSTDAGEDSEDQTEIQKCMSFDWLNH